ncbi:hypothetical protein BKI52_32910 [marine bacterium AO1-C]|nr:hypothetical protein BKI52_32910 [marine bacterium AO1-C]
MKSLNPKYLVALILILLTFTVYNCIVVQKLEWKSKTNLKNRKLYFDRVNILEEQEPGPGPSFKPLTRWYSDDISDNFLSNNWINVTQIYRLHQEKYSNDEDLIENIWEVSSKGDIVVRKGYYINSQSFENRLYDLIEKEMKDDVVDRVNYPPKDRTQKRIKKELSPYRAKRLREREAISLWLIGRKKFRNHPVLSRMSRCYQNGSDLIKLSLPNKKPVFYKINCSKKQSFRDGKKRFFLVLQPDNAKRVDKDQYIYLLQTYD